MDVRSIQQALKDQGFDTGPIDGIWGRQSIAALRAFQSARGLTVDGIAGPQTIRALDASKRAGRPRLPRSAVRR
jgi:peptidoglycan hydrolase-like protein with peptidoglycan-binding domain